MIIFLFFFHLISFKKEKIYIFLFFFIGNFYQNEITPVQQEEYRIAKVLKEKGDKRYVSWRGYPQRYNSWISASNIRKIK